MNAKTAKLINRSARENGVNPRNVKRQWNTTPRKRRSFWRQMLKRSVGKEAQ